MDHLKAAFVHLRDAVGKGDHGLVSNLFWNSSFIYIDQTP